MASHRPRGVYLTRMAFDIEAARIAYRQRISARRDARERRRLQAQREAEKVIEYIKERYSPRRIIQWGSIVRPEHQKQILLRGTVVYERPDPA